MRFEHKQYGKMTEILRNDHWAAIPVTVYFDPDVEVVKAGTPLTRGGVKATGSEVAGILLYDVDKGNPNGSIVYHGAIETQRAEAWSGVQYTQAIKDALPQILFG